MHLIINKFYIAVARQIVLYLRSKNKPFMRKIEMVDLKTQYDHISDEIEAAFREVIASSAFINGEPVRSLADELSQYLGISKVIPCANGTDALQIALMAF